MDTSKKPSKPWRVTITTASGDTTTACRGEQAAYDVINGPTIRRSVKAGDKFTVEHWEGGRWVLWERGVFTANSWESA